MRSRRSEKEKKIIEALMGRDYGPALKMSREYLVSSPENHSTHRCAGLSYLKNGIVSKASAHLDQALELNPDQPETHFGLGEIAFGKGKIARAIEHLTIATQSDYFKGEAYALLSTCFAHAGRLDDAVSLAEKALRHLGKESGERIDTIKSHISFYQSIGAVVLNKISRNDGKASFNFKHASSGHILIPITINGVNVDSAVLDTGNSGDLIVTEEFARNFNLQLTGKFAGYGIAGKVDFSKTLLPEVGIGGCSIRNVPANVSKAPLACNIEVVVGRSLLQYFELVLDFRRSALSFSLPHSSDHGHVSNDNSTHSERIPFTYQKLMVVEISAGNGPVGFILDSGAPITIFDLDYFEEKIKPGISQDDIIDAAVQGVAGKTQTAQLFRFDKLAIGGRLLPPVQAAAMDLSYVFDKAQLRCAGILGMNCLSDVTLHMMFPQSYLFIE